MRRNGGLNLKRLAEPRRVRAFARAVVLCTVFSIGLRYVPPKRIFATVARRNRRVLSRNCRPRRAALRRRSRDRHTDRLSPRVLVQWAVPAAAKRVPGANCLPRALAGSWMLAQAGLPSELRIGVAPEDGTLLAHAWLEVDGEVLIGGTRSPDRFAVLPDLPMDLIAAGRWR